MIFPTSDAVPLRRRIRAAVAVALALGAGLGGNAVRAAVADFHVEVPTRRGNSGLGPDDLVVRAVGPNGERELGVAEVAPIDGGWDVVVLFDLEFSDTATIRASAATLARQSDRLVALGDVVIVTQRDGIQSRTPATREAAVLRDALSWIELEERGDDAQVVLRSRALAARGEADESEVVAASIRTERERLVAMIDRALLWLADRGPSPRPKLLIWVTSGFDVDPASDKRAGIVRSGTRVGREPGVALEDLETLLLADGWTTLVLGLSEDLPESLRELGEAAAPGAPDLDTLRPPEERRGEALITTGAVADRIDERARSRLQVGRLDDVEALVMATGGRSTVDAEVFLELLEGFASRWSVGLNEGLGLAEDERLAVSLTGSGRRRDRSAEIVAPRRPRGERPGAVSEIRLREYLRGDVDSGNLSFSAVVENRGTGPELLVQLEVAEFDGVPASIAVAAAVDGVEPIAVTRSSIVGDREPAIAARSLFTVDLPGMELDAGTEERLVVALEDRRTGDWGVEYATVLEPVVELVEEEPSLFLPAPKPVQLLAPTAALVAGKTNFETVISDRSVDAVDFYLDGKRFASVTAPPFRATADLGRLPELREIEVVAFRGGRELGRDTLRINEGSGGFRVRIVQPSPDAAERMTGPVRIGAEVDLPRGLRVDRLEYFWNETLVASRTEAPWVERVLVPSDDPRGFVRVVAQLEDGSTSEDVLFFNSPGAAERLDVNLVELYVVVSERDGTPVQGLERGDFSIEEDGETQRIATFSDAGNLPLTLGLAIDSSASMFIKLPKVQQAAASFLESLAPNRDRAFLVGFGDEPTIHRDTTTQVDRVVRALDRLEPDGQTGIWKGIVYSLVQLQGVPGRKALVVYSDGADEDADFSYRTCLQFARKVGVPIYVILSNNEIVRTGGKSLKVAGFLDRLEKMTREVGGRVFLTRVGDDMHDVYARIEDEIRSQYLIGYYSEHSAADRWRKVEVDTPGRRNYRTRTVSGVFR